MRCSSSKIIEVQWQFPSHGKRWHFCFQHIGLHCIVICRARFDLSIPWFHFSWNCRSEHVVVVAGGRVLAVLVLISVPTNSVIESTLGMLERPLIFSLQSILWHLRFWLLQLLRFVGIRKLLGFCGTTHNLRFGKIGHGDSSHRFFGLVHFQHSTCGIGPHLLFFERYNRLAPSFLCPVWCKGALIFRKDGVSTDLFLILWR